MKSASIFSDIDYSTCHFVSSSMSTVSISFYKITTKRFANTITIEYTLFLEWYLALQQPFRINTPSKSRSSPPPIGFELVHPHPFQSNSLAPTSLDMEEERKWWKPARSRTSEVRWPRFRPCCSLLLFFSNALNHQPAPVVGIPPWGLTGARTTCLSVRLALVLVDSCRWCDVCVLRNAGNGRSFGDDDRYGNRR